MNIRLCSILAKSIVFLQLLSWSFDPNYMVRGLVLDKKRGNILKVRLTKCLIPLHFYQGYIRRLHGFFFVMLIVLSLHVFRWIATNM
jgi:hypothetical protein